MVGAIVWELPGQWKAGILQQLRMLPSIARINGRLLPRVLRALAVLESNHPVEPHYYLPVVGVAPGWQGRGPGTALMRPILDRCDEEKMPAYLEATWSHNRALYERHGFEVTEQFLLGPGRHRCGGCGELLVPRLAIAPLPDPTGRCAVFGSSE